MKKLITKHLVLLTILFFQACDQENKQYVNSSETSLFKDVVDDTNNVNIDIRQANVDISDESIEIEIELKSLPSKLVFNHNKLPENNLNYRWSVVFDIDNDYMKSEGDLNISISKFKFESDIEALVNIFNTTQHDIWKINSDGGGAKIASISRYVDVLENKFVISLPKSINQELIKITSETNFYIETFHNNG
ncbi:MAG: hypothetical protein P1U56_25965, partial [Saprospiraceae bacterium]|nr:hypothetical protein [Saprospiraceae bacterium]